jgi:hypothetical protein
MQQQLKHISVRLPKWLDRWLRIEAAKRDMSRSHWIRFLLAKEAKLRAGSAQIDHNVRAQEQSQQEAELAQRETRRNCNDE